MSTDTVRRIRRATLAGAIVLVVSGHASADPIRRIYQDVQVTYKNDTTHPFRDIVAEDSSADQNRSVDLTPTGGTVTSQLVNRVRADEFELGVSVDFVPIRMKEGVEDSIWNALDLFQRSTAGIKDTVTVVGSGAGSLQFQFALDGWIKYGWEKIGGAAELEMSRGDLSFYVIRDAEPIALVAAWELETQGLEERGQTKGDRQDISRTLTVALPYIGGQDFSVEFQLIALNQARLLNIDGGEIHGAMESYAMSTAKLLGVSVLDPQGNPVPNPTILSSSGIQYAVVPPTAVPEPATAVLMAVPLLAASLRRRRSRRALRE